MYNLMQSCSYISTSNRILDAVYLQSKVSLVNADNIEADCGIHECIRLSRKEEKAIFNSKYFTRVNQSFMLKCAELELTHNTQIVDLTSYTKNLEYREYHRHINTNIWRILTYYQLNSISIYALVLSIHRSTVLLGIGGITMNMNFRRSNLNYRNRYRNLLFTK